MSAHDELLSELRELAKTPKTPKTWPDYADAILAAGYRKPRTITTEAELEKLPIETVIRTAHGSVREKNSLGYWYAMGDEDMNGIPFGSFPATVLYEPEAGK